MPLTQYIFLKIRNTSIRMEIIKLLIEKLFRWIYKIILLLFLTQ